jgi:hypothetical protein
MISGESRVLNKHHAWYFTSTCVKVNERRFEAVLLLTLNRKKKKAYFLADVIRMIFIEDCQRYNVRGQILKYRSECYDLFPWTTNPNSPAYYFRSHKLCLSILQKHVYRHIGDNQTIIVLFVPMKCLKSKFVAFK